MTKQEFSKSMQTLLDFYKHELTPFQVRVWFELFEPFDKKKFDFAINKHLRTDEDTRFPALGKIMNILNPRVMG